ncbi:hypothetical protein [Methanobacterium sp.]|uniref:hypothetical protein n=1 Tax=Methanobacterium sp. TaxID=2164 RepID=UPI003C76392E
MTAEINSALNKFLLCIKRVIDEEVKNKPFSVRTEEDKVDKVNSFDYSLSDGIINLDVSSEFNTKKFIESKYKARLIRNIKKRKEYVDLLKRINKDFPGLDDKYMDILFNRLMKEILNHRLDSLNFLEEYTDFIYKRVLKYLNGKTLKYEAKSNFYGIILQEDEIVISEGIILRKPNKEDLEDSINFPHFICDVTTAVLEIEFLDYPDDIAHNKVFSKIKRYAHILSLFKVGTVFYNQTQYSSEAFNGSGSAGSLEIEVVLKNYTIFENDKDNLVNFWQVMDRCMPNEKDSPCIDYLSISYQRYQNSLERGSLEKRVSSVMMGLEALFLKSNERIELNHRLSLRVAKIFSLLGYDALKIKKSIKESYNIRSTFVHGGHYEPEELIKLENNRFKNKLKILNDEESLDDHLYKIIDYLRISIVIITLFRGSEFDKNDKKKEKFLDLIDDALIDKEKEDYLKNYLENLEIYGIISSN